MNKQTQGNQSQERRVWGIETGDCLPIANCAPDALSGAFDQAIETKAPRQMTRSGVLNVGYEAAQEMAMTVNLWPRVDP